MDEWESYFDDILENSAHESCPKCGYSFDDADYDFQICSRCGFDCEE